MKNLKIAGLSDVGMAREKNEDSLFAKLYDDMAVLAVADGMGGYTGGQFASGIVVQAVQRLFDINRKRLSPAELIEDSLVLANTKIRELSRSRYEGMTVGSTVALAVVRPPQVHFANLGDSRMYYFRGSDVVQKTRDHTMLQKLLEAGALKPEEAANYAHKNIVYKSVNGEEGLEIEPVQTFALGKEDILLLCSDGLSNYLRPEEMLRILQGTSNLQEAAGYMVNLANHRGGDDNITIVLLEHGKYRRVKGLKLERVSKAKRPGKPRRRLWALAPLFVLLAAAVTLLVVGLKDEKALSRWLGRFSEKKSEKAAPSTVKHGKLPRVEGALKTVALRAQAASLTEDEARRMCVEKDFFCKTWNPDGGISHRFVEEDTDGAGLVADQVTGLMWSRKFTRAAPTIPDAENLVADMNHLAFGGYSDWRLPTLEEAASLLEADPNDDGQHISGLFSPGPHTVWTSDRLSGMPDTPWRWCVDYSNGFICRMPESPEDGSGQGAFVFPVRRHIN